MFNTNEVLVSKPTVPLLKHLGFPLQIFGGWNLKGGAIESITSPTQAVVQRWIREVHNIEAAVHRHPNVKKYSAMYIPHEILPKESKNMREYYDKFSIYYSKERHDKYEDALEEAILGAINIIVKRDNYV